MEFEVPGISLPRRTITSTIVCESGPNRCEEVEKKDGGVADRGRSGRMTV